MSDILAKTPARAQKWGALQVLAFLLGVADGALTFMIYMWGLIQTDRGDVRVAIGCVILASFTGTVVHELGHAVAALICGWRIVVFTVKPFAWRIPSSSLAVVSRQTFPQFAGFVTAVPGSAKALTVRRWMAFIAGGPVASLVFAVYLGGVAFVLWGGGAASPNMTFLAAICAGFGVHSAGVCIRTLLPRTGTGFSSDGAKLLKAFGKADKLAEGKAGLWLLALMKYKIRPRDLPAWMIAAMRAEPAGARFADSLEISRLLDAKSPDFAEARRRIEAFRERHGASEWLAGCDAYLAAMYEGDTDRAERALAAPHPKRQVPELILAARAALSARLGLPGETAQYLAQMEAVLRQESPFRNDCYADIRRDIEALLRVTRQTRKRRADIAPDTPGSVPYHV